MTNSTITGGSITYSTGIMLDVDKGKAPERTPKELIATRAIETMDGWIGQIIMSGEIVWESDTYSKYDDDRHLSPSEQALGHVNERIHEAFRRLITGKK